MVGLILTSKSYIFSKRGKNEEEIWIPVQKSIPLNIWKQFECYKQNKMQNKETYHGKQFQRNAYPVGKSEHVSM